MPVRLVRQTIRLSRSRCSDLGGTPHLHRDVVTARDLRALLVRAAAERGFPGRRILSARAADPVGIPYIATPDVEVDYDSATARSMPALPALIEKYMVWLATSTNDVLIANAFVWKEVPLPDPAAGTLNRSGISTAPPSGRAPRCAPLSISPCRPIGRALCCATTNHDRDRPFRPILRLTEAPRPMPPTRFWHIYSNSPTSVRPARVSYILRSHLRAYLIIRLLSVTLT